MYNNIKRVSHCVLPLSNNSNFFLVKKMEDAMTADEKRKLYEAIGYQENVAATEYPVTFVATRLRFVLVKACVRVLDEDLVVINAELNDLRAQLDQRPAASALRLVRIQCFLLVLG